MDGENNGKPNPVKMDDLGCFSPYFWVDTHIGSDLNSVRKSSQTSPLLPWQSQVLHPTWDRRNWQTSAVGKSGGGIFLTPHYLVENLGKSGANLVVQKLWHGKLVEFQRNHFFPHILSVKKKWVFSLIHFKACRARWVKRWPEPKDRGFLVTWLLVYFTCVELIAYNLLI